MKFFVCLALSLIVSLSSAFQNLNIINFSREEEVCSKEIFDNGEYIFEVSNDCLLDFFNANNYSSFGSFLKTNEAFEIRENLRNERKNLIDIYGKYFKIICEYDVFFNGFAFYYDGTHCELLNDKHIYKSINYSLSSVDDYKVLQTNVNEITSNCIYDSSSLEYKGDGMLIGVIDSGIDKDHSAFSINPTKPKIESGSYYGDMKLSFSDVKGYENLFLSPKIPFGYDYCGKDFDVKNAKGGDHGYHVGGILAGNGAYREGIFPIRKEFKGVAPNAQIAMFKVFQDADKNSISGGSLTEIINALSDALIIGCDVINMSISIEEVYGIGKEKFGLEQKLFDVCNKLEKQGVAVYCACGNSGTALSQKEEIIYPSTNNPDYSIICSPAGYSSTFAVANGNISLGSSSINESSSSGVLGDLSICPDVTAPGTNVYSSVVKNGYEFKTGTSMACPNLAGVGTLLLQKYKNGYNNIKQQNNIDYSLKDFCNYLIMSTAKPLSGELVRKQGSGLASLNEAINTQTFLTFNGKKPSVSLGDDKQKNGSYNFNFELHNLGDTNVSYNLSNVTMVESVKNGKLTGLGQKVSATCNFGNGASVQVSPHESVTVSVALQLDSLTKEYLNKNFKNGMFVEGFINLESTKASNLSIPYLVYYGDYEKLNPIDTFDFSEKNVDSKLSTITVQSKSHFLGTLTTYKLGSSLSNGAKKDLKYMALPIDRSTSNGNVTIKSLNFCALRNIKNMKISYCQDNYNYVSYVHTLDRNYSYILKSSLDAETDKLKEYNVDVSFSAKSNEWNYGFPASCLKKGGYLYFNVDCGLEYNTTSSDYNNRITVPIYLDGTNPLIEKITLNSVGLSVVVSDDHYVDYVTLLERKEGKFYPVSLNATVNASSVAESSEANLVLTNNNLSEDKLYVYCRDYAGNESIVQIDDFSLKSNGIIYDSEVDENPFIDDIKEDFDLGCFSSIKYNGFAILCVIIGLLILVKRKRYF